MGEFELALVFYHRGKKLRGDVKEFQLGINKAQEAIHSVKLEVKGDLSYFDKPDEVIHFFLIIFFCFITFIKNKPINNQGYKGLFS